MVRNTEGSVVDFTRGSELWLYQIRMFFEGMLSACLIALLIGLTVATGYAYLKLDEREIHYSSKYYAAQMKKIISVDKQNLGNLEMTIDGKIVTAEVEEIIKFTEPAAKRTLSILKNACILGGLVGIGLTVFLGFYWTYFGKRAMSDEKIRGASLVESETLKQLLLENNDASPYQICGIPMRQGSETLNILIAGAPGSGKSQQFLAIFRQIRARGKRAIVYDPSGEFAQALYREGKDKILNPLDERSPNWNPWQEIKEDYHYENMY